MTDIAAGESSLLQDLKSRKRAAHVFEVNDILGLDKKAVKRVAVRVATKWEQDLAAASAHAYVQRLAENKPGVLTDPDILVDAKSCAILATVIRDADRPDEMPVFPTGTVVAELLSSEQISSLVALANQVRRVESTTPDGITEEQLEAVIKLCVSAQETELPEAVLAKFSRVHLEQMTILMALRLDEARKAAAGVQSDSQQP